MGHPVRSGLSVCTIPRATKQGHGAVPSVFGHVAGRLCPQASNNAVGYKTPASCPLGSHNSEPRVLGWLPELSRGIKLWLSLVKCDRRSSLLWLPSLPHLVSPAPHRSFPGSPQINSCIKCLCQSPSEQVTGENKHRLGTRQREIALSLSCLPFRLWTMAMDFLSIYIYKMKHF